MIQLDLVAHNLTAEKFFVADEAGIHWRIECNIGHLLGAVFDVQAVDMRFVDFKPAWVGK